jgi:hypothetical protein
MEQTMLFLNQPIIYDKTKGTGKLGNTIKNRLEQLFVPDSNSDLPKNIQFENWINDKMRGITTDIMKSSIVELNPKKIHESNNEDLLISQLYVDNAFRSLSKQSRFTQSVSSLLSLNKGLESTFFDNKKFDRAVNDTELGHILAWSNKDDYKGAIKDYLEAGVISKSGDKYIKGPNYPDITNPNIPFDPRLAIINDPNTLQNVLLQKKATGEIAKKFFLSQTNFFRDLTGLVSGNQDSYKYLRSLVMSRAYQKYLQENNETKFNDLRDKYSQVGGTLKSDPNNIGKQLLQLKANEAFQKNPLVRILTIGDNPKSKYVDINFPTRIKTDSDYYVSLVNGFEELFRNKDTKQFAINLFHYAYFKDGLEFKNNSFINAIGSWMFKDVSNSLDKTNEELATRSTNLTTLFRSEVETAKDFIKSYVADVNTQENSVKKFKVEDFGGVTTRLDNGKSYEVNLFKDTKFDHTIFSDPDKLNLAMLDERLQKNLEFIEGRFGINDADKNTNFKYPVSFISPSGWDINTGEMYSKKAYVLDKLTKLEDDGTIKEYSLDDVIGLTLNSKTDNISGLKALYKLVDPIGDKLLNSSVLTYDKARELYKDPKISEVKKEAVIAPKEEVKEEAKIDDNSQEAKDQKMYEESKDLGKFLFGEFHEGDIDDAIPNDDINNHLNDIDDTDLPIC